VRDLIIVELRKADSEPGFVPINDPPHRRRVNIGNSVFAKATLRQAAAASGRGEFA